MGNTGSRREDPPRELGNQEYHFRVIAMGRREIQRRDPQGIRVTFLIFSEARCRRSMILPLGEKLPAKILTAARWHAQSPDHSLVKNSVLHQVINRAPHCCERHGCPTAYRLNQMRWAPGLLRSGAKRPWFRSARDRMSAVALLPMTERPLVEP